MTVLIRDFGGICAWKRPNSGLVLSAALLARSLHVTKLLHYLLELAGRVGLCRFEFTSMLVPQFILACGFVSNALVFANQAKHSTLALDAITIAAVTQSFPFFTKSWTQNWVTITKSSFALMNSWQYIYWPAVPRTNNPILHWWNLLLCFTAYYSFVQWFLLPSQHKLN